MDPRGPATAEDDARDHYGRFRPGVSGNLRGCLPAGGAAGMAEQRRKGLPAAGKAAKAGKVAPPPPERPFSAREQALLFGVIPKSG
jgi:hypothetical protein